MEKVSLKCSNCGAILETTKDSNNKYHCPHCGNIEILKPNSSSNYFVNQNITKNIYSSEEYHDEDYFKNINIAEKFIEIDEYEDALTFIEKAKSIDAGNYLAWWLSAKIKLLQNINEIEVKSELFPMSEIKKDFKKACILAEDDIKANITEEYNNLIDQYNETETALTNRNSSEIQIKSNTNITISLGILEVFILISIFTIIAGISLSAANENGLFLLISMVGLVLLLLTIISIKKQRENEKILNYIAQKNHTSIAEIYTYCNHENIDIKNIEDLRKRIKYLIENNYLKDYILNNDEILKQ